jgi:hypothetical protein
MAVSAVSVGGGRIRRGIGVAVGCGVGVKASDGEVLGLGLAGV